MKLRLRRTNDEIKDYLEITYFRNVYRRRIRIYLRKNYKGKLRCKERNVLKITILMLKNFLKKLFRVKLMVNVLTD